MAETCQLSLLPPVETRPSLRDVAEAVREAGVDGLPDARRRADQARYQEVHVRSALDRRPSGCRSAGRSTRTAGARTRASTATRGSTSAISSSAPAMSFPVLIFVKTNLPEVLAREVTRRTWAHETVAIGTATDPYQPIEGHYKLTRRSTRSAGRRAHAVQHHDQGPDGRPRRRRARRGLTPRELSRVRERAVGRRDRVGEARAGDGVARRSDCGPCVS